MSTSNDLLKKRIRPLMSHMLSTGKCVIYVMSRDQRVQDNHALLAAQKHALAKQLPLLVVFCVYNTGYRSREHYSFMLDGLEEVRHDLEALGMPFLMTEGKPKKVLPNICSQFMPDAVYFDFNPLKGPRKLLQFMSEAVKISMFVVDTHNIIPCWVASDKKEFSAATFRPKVHRAIGEFLSEPEQVVKHPYQLDTVHGVSDFSFDREAFLQSIQPSGITISWTPGESSASKSLQTFIDTKLVQYGEDRNDPSLDALSDLSQYLHFGHISSLRVALEMQKIIKAKNSTMHLLNSDKMPKPENFSDETLASIASLLEEMIVRKELADNYCYYEDHYTSIDGAADWVKETIKIHDADSRDHLYDKTQLENAQTHDEAWNAAQRQLTKTGKMHGYMRMYWAKKVKEWTPDAQTAIDFLIELNDRYSIDGGDPNGYVGIMWSVCGVHDRPWTERDVFGKIRYMNYAGLKRKFDVLSYEMHWQ